MLNSYDSTTMKVFIPVKLESERVYGKNFRLLPNGKPLWQHTIEKYHNHEVYVDTDSEALLEQLQDYPYVTAYRRHHLLVGNSVSVCDLILHCIKKYKIRGWLYQTHVTSLFLSDEMIRAVEESLMMNPPDSSRHDSYASCRKFQSRLWRAESFGYCPVNHNPIDLKPTQLLPAYYEENSSFYVVNADVFRKNPQRIGPNVRFWPINAIEGFDIDTETDWSIMEAIFNAKHQDVA